MKTRTIRNSFLLFLTACIWGLAFVSQSKGMESMGAFTFNGVRCLIGVLALGLYLGILFLFGKKKMGGIDWKSTCRAGLICGVLFTLATNLQQIGIAGTTVGKAGFITTLYIFFVPIGGLFLGKKCGKIVWIGACVAAVGLYLLCMVGEGLFMSSGDFLVLLCSLVFACHILVVDHYSEKADGVIVSWMQFVICGVISTGIALFTEQPGWQQLRDGQGALLYAGVLSCGVAYTLQIVGQRDVNPTIAALILSLESVVACVGGYAAYKIGFLSTDQTLTLPQIAGCVLVFVAVVMVQLPWDKWKKRV